MKDTLVTALALIGVIVAGVIGFAAVVVVWLLTLALYGALLGAIAAGAYWAFKLLAGML